jgi:hypothetical protein
MKKIFCVVLMLSSVVCGIFAQNSTSGVIRELSGEVELKRAGTSAFVAARVGDRVARDTIVSTGFKGSAVIAVGSAVITVRPLTRLSLAEIQNSADTENLNVNLQTGRVRVEVTPPAGSRANCAVQGPSATASVRGTRFEFDTVNLRVTEGRVAFSGPSGLATMVNAGSENSIGTDNEPATALTKVSLPTGGTRSSTSPVAQQGFSIEYGNND